MQRAQRQPPRQLPWKSRAIPSVSLHLNSQRLPFDVDVVLPHLNIATQVYRRRIWIPRLPIHLECNNTDVVAFRGLPEKAHFRVPAD